MNADEYQDKAASTRSYPEYAQVLYPLLGLAGELSEVVSVFYDRMWPYAQAVPEWEEQFKDALLALLTVGRRCETLKKQVRGGDLQLTDEQKAVTKQQIDVMRQGWEIPQKLTQELSDCLWYVASLFTDLDMKLTDGMKDNLAKLAARKQKGAIHNHLPDSKDHLEVQQ